MSARESQLTSFELCLTVPGVLLQALLLVDDDVLDVLHRQVVAKGVKQNVFQLLQGDPLHVELRGDMQRWEEVFFSFTAPLAFSWSHVTALYSCQQSADHKLLHARASTKAHLSHGQRLTALSISEAEDRPSSPEQAKEWGFVLDFGNNWRHSPSSVYYCRLDLSTETLTSVSASNEQARLSAGSGSSLLLLWFWRWLKCFLATLQCLFPHCSGYLFKQSFCQNKMKASSVSVAAKPGGRLLFSPAAPRSRSRRSFVFPPVLLWWIKTSPPAWRKHRR